MKIDEIRDTITWQNLMVHPKFLESFEEIIQRCSLYMDINDLIISVSDKKMTISYHSDVLDRDFDCQFKLYNHVELSLDNDNNLIINESSGTLESNYGYSFKDTLGGKLNTRYSYHVYDADGIELSYQSYGDRYILDQNTFDAYKKDFSTVIKEAYNPKLGMSTNNQKPYNRPSVMGSERRFLKRVRSGDNLGIVKVIKCSFDSRPKEEYYFNTSFGGMTNASPELMHLISGFPFATMEDSHLKIMNEYQGLGINDHNYKEVARTRFLKELQEQKDKCEDPVILDKYDLMIEKLHKELGISSKTR